MTKHTPGPWQRPKTNGETIIVGGDYADEGEPDLIITVQSSSNELNQLNAHLIAAAPELYEALKEYEKWEAALILDDEVWAEGAMPRLTEELYDWMIRLQGMRNVALERAEGVSDR